MSVSVLNTNAQVSGKTLAILENANTFTALQQFSAFGTQAFSASGTGTQTLKVENTLSGAANWARIIGTAGTSIAFFDTYSQGYTTGSYDRQSGAALVAQGSGGLGLAATDAAGIVRFFAGGAVERAQVNSSGVYAISGGFYMATWPTTANAANAYVADGTYVQRSTSSLRYKTDIETLDIFRAASVIQSLRPITYRGIHDGPTRFPGFAAEEVAELDPMLVTYDKEGRPDYVQYDRISAYLVPVIQEQERRIAALESKLNG